MEEFQKPLFGQALKNVTFQLMNKDEDKEVLIKVLFLWQAKRTGEAHRGWALCSSIRASGTVHGSLQKERQTSPVPNRTGIQVHHSQPKETGYNSGCHGAEQILKTPRLSVPVQVLADKHWTVQEHLMFLWEEPSDFHERRSTWS